MSLERLGFITRIRRIRRVTTPLGFVIRQISNAYRVHEPTSGLGLLAMAVFASESNYRTPSETDGFKKEENRAKAQVVPSRISNGSC